MKTLYFSIFCFTLILFSGVKNCFSQVLSYIVVVGDTVSLNLTGGYGDIQWQHCTDSINYVDIPGAINNPQTIIVASSSVGKRYFRAKVTDQFCPLMPGPWYSSIIKHKVLASTTQVAIGDFYNGGIVFYTNGSGQGLIAPQWDQHAGIEWGCMGTSLPGTSSLTDGVSNTIAILAGCSTRPIAASVCSDMVSNDYNDWYLPAKDQLSYLYAQRAIVGNFASWEYYHSSSEATLNSAWIQNFGSGGQTAGGKNGATKVRCIRSYTSINNTVHTLCFATITGQPTTVELLAHPQSQNKCLGSNVTFSVSVNGNAPILYQWKKDGNNINGATSNSYSLTNLSLADEGIYTCEVSNICRSISSDNAELKVVNISNNAGLDIKICKGQNTQLNAIASSNHPTESGVLSYSWSPSLGLNFLNISNPMASPLNDQLYSLLVTDQLGCSKTDQINVFVGNPYQNQEICLVTVDTISWKNKVMWEKVIGDGTSYYLIYKETGLNSYSQVGNSSISQPAEFIDLFSAPESHGDKYKISVLDTCGNESDLSFYHKTMNLVISSFGSTMGLMWDDYIDESGAYSPFRYYIYRGTSLANMSLLDSVSGSFNTYNDINVFNVYYYIICVKKNNSCNTTKSNFISYSNKKDNSTLLGIYTQLNCGTINVSPNPFSERTIISIPNTHVSSNNVQLKVTDVTGKIVRIINFSAQNSKQSGIKIEIERGDLKPGVYFLECYIGRVFRGKLVIE